MKKRKPDKAYALISQKKGLVWVASIRGKRKEVVAYANTIAPWPWKNKGWEIKPIKLTIETIEKEGGI